MPYDASGRWRDVRTEWDAPLTSGFPWGSACVTALCVALAVYIVVTEVWG